jgi:hypothetical protein
VRLGCDSGCWGLVCRIFNNVATGRRLVSEDSGHFAQDLHDTNAGSKNTKLAPIALCMDTVKDMDGSVASKSGEYRSLARRT